MLSPALRSASGRESVKQKARSNAGFFVCDDCRAGVGWRKINPTVLVTTVGHFTSEQR